MCVGESVYIALKFWLIKLVCRLVSGSLTLMLYHKYNTCAKALMPTSSFCVAFYVHIHSCLMHDKTDVFNSCICNGNDFLWPELGVCGTAGQPWSRNAGILTSSVCVCVFMSYCFTLAQQRKKVESGSVTHTHTHKIRWSYHCRHRHTRTDGRGVTNKAAGPPPSCFCHCSSSCFCAVVDIQTSTWHTLKLWSNTRFLKSSLASDGHWKFSPCPGSGSLFSKYNSCTVQECLCGTGAVTYW